ncbi:hypothetical protein [Marinifilum fragile]|uniref:hypothetical protein n=1 Tax=Marinifilum fragile TaxID=570161 RepID=UPI002AA7A775|nr:hypothetical protein [Marinifilum fragile]
MKTINLLLVCFFLVLFNACDDNSSDMSLDDTSEFSVLNKEISKTASLFDLDIEGEVISFNPGATLKDSLKNTFVKSQQNLWNFDEVSVMEFKDKDGNIVKNTVIPLKDSPWTMCSIIEKNGEIYSQVLDYVFDEEKSTMCYYINESINPIDPITLKSWGSRWMGCMKGVLASEVGVIITVAGVAGGVGCVPCAGVAAFYTGVFALGCMAA